jgi:hypothetical protein
MSSFEFIVTPELCDLVPEGWLVELYDTVSPIQQPTAAELVACSLSWRGTEDSDPIIAAEFACTLYFPDRNDQFFDTLYYGLESVQEGRMIVRIRRNIPGAPTPYWYGVIVNDLTTYTWGECDVTVNLYGGEGWEALKTDFTTPPLNQGQEEIGLLSGFAHIINRSIVGTWLPATAAIPRPYVITQLAFTTEITAYAIQYSMWHPWAGLFYDIATDDETKVPVDLYTALQRLLRWAGLRLFQWGGRVFIINEGGNSLTGSNALEFSKTVLEARGSNSPVTGSIAPYKYPPVGTPVLAQNFYGTEGFIGPIGELSTGLDDIRNLPRIGATPTPPPQFTTNGPHTITIGTAAAGNGLFYRYFFSVQHRCSFSSNTLKTLRCTFQVKCTSGPETYYFDGTSWGTSAVNIVREQTVLPIAGDPWVEVDHILFYPQMPSPPDNGVLSVTYTTTASGGGVGLLFTQPGWDVSYLLAPGSGFNGIGYFAFNDGTNKASSIVRSFENNLWSFTEFDPNTFPLGWRFYVGGSLKRVENWYFPPFNATPRTYWQYILDLRLFRRYLHQRYLDAEVPYSLGPSPVVQASVAGGTVNLYPLEWSVDMVKGTVRGRWWSLNLPNVNAYFVRRVAEIR